MKVFFAIFLFIGYVSARGSGPYLPRGWKPDGPAFYLPSEVTKPTPSPVQVSLLQETEASGSDAFREYGPPKLEEVSISANQVLPEEATEHAFLVEVKNEDAVVAVQETVNAEANAELTATIVEEVSTATESQAAAVVQTIEEQVTELSDVPSTAGTQSLDLLDQAVETSEAVQLEAIKEEIVSTVADIKLEEIKEEVVPTVADVKLEEIKEEIVPTVADVKLEEIKEEVVPSVVNVKLEEIKEEAIPTAANVKLEEVTEEIVPTAVAVEELVPTVAIVEDIATPTAAVEEVVVSTVIGEAVEDAVIPTAVADAVVVPLAQQELVQDAAPTPSAEVVVEKVAEGVSNIAEALVYLEKEVKAAEVQVIQNVAEITSIQEASGLLEQAPEGFLEYGPPGFAEYGPPKQEDLARLAVEVASGNILENYEVRRRRFSPKFRSTKKL